MFQSINPTTEQVIADYPVHNATEVDALLEKAHKAQAGWAEEPIEKRVQLLHRAATILREREEQYGALITEEMGKPISEARAEVLKCAKTLDYYAEHAAGILKSELIASDATESGIVYDPLGVVLAIMPWNYPFWQFFRFAAPALAAGNATVLKHANNVPGSAKAVQSIFVDAGAPEGLTTTLFVQSKDVKGIIEDPRIAAVTFTGSTQVGSIIAAQAGAVIKPQVLELGGSDPFIVLADANVRDAAKAAVKARFTNVGQSCVNAKRFVVVDEIADEFVTAFVEETKKLMIGDPHDPATNIGPMARENLRAELHDQVERSIASGATLLLGGQPLQRPGYFYPPTILDNVEKGHAAFDEETFGPVAAIIRVRDAHHAIEVANDTEFGLAAALWTGSIDKAKQLLHKIEAGAVFVNSVVASDPRLPFGGIKSSGYGRELGSHGMREFLNIKTFSIGA
ncbi:aldehyde dehydrogenase [Corynebacterium glutamicum MT]|uniref:NADP-dependent succinic semialdehyde dehydrogenase n=1 Tax=Corynebacterium glutamicum TaxID=1718 RepID=A0AB36IFN3_CORGT|nr:NAD-dependent succinate-semialdehyde dehydrogenase [Corynebacterium glutamicum]AGN18410.1 aldehyde dehydrogenase [Corynebacterium glutamicum SCgG1]AGN21433.1 aldehyde dehydrogenase [Corynebacterium glutamicum SCgG2]EGV41701.1 aldehyde dehydrogenase [Corynebacterium glutamicum S9114]EOA65672.1 aldehyde dehydrogenase [Corynebacterium glutamicum MT]EPP41563.1 aldehyde dehydrogenase [Corynebacterium glutamicum Z188]